MSITIKRSGNGINGLFKEIGRIRRFGPFLKEIGQSIESSTKIRFNKGVDPEGETWIPSQRVILQGRGRTLVKTGRLQKSISYASDESEVNIGTDVEYAESVGDGPPRREFLGISQQDEQEIERIIQKHVEG
jgi:phage virion morphogenesis protein